MVYATVWLINVLQGSCVIGLVSGLALLGVRENFKRWEVFRLLEVCPWGAGGTTAPSSVSCFPAMRQAGFVPPGSLNRICCHASTQNNRVNQSWTTISKTVSQSKPFLFINLFISDTCYSDGKLTQFIINYLAKKSHLNWLGIQR
jgi:hypothetical protein